MKIKHIISNYLKELILLIPVIGYSLLYIFELGYVNYFNIPAKYITTSFQEYLGVIVLIIAVIVCVVLVCYFHFKTTVFVTLLYCKVPDFLGKKINLPKRFIYLSKTIFFISIHFLLRYFILLLTLRYYLKIIDDKDVYIIWGICMYFIFGVLFLWDTINIYEFSRTQNQLYKKLHHLNFKIFTTGIDYSYYVSSGIIYYCCLAMIAYATGYWSASKQRSFEGFSNCNNIVLYYSGEYLITTSCQLKTKQYTIMKLERAEELKTAFKPKCECK